MRDTVFKRAVALLVSFCMILSGNVMVFSAGHIDAQEYMLIGDASPVDGETSPSDGTTSPSDGEVSGTDGQVSGTDGNYRPSNPKKDMSGNTVYDYLYFGRYYQKDTNGDGVADEQDKKTQVKWRVLQVDLSGNTALIVSEEALDCKNYNDDENGDYGVTWTESTIRSWLNGYGEDYNRAHKDYTEENFINSAFSENDRSIICSSRISGEDNIYNGTYGGTDSFDKIFLLSYAEVVNAGSGFKPYVSNLDGLPEAGSYEEELREFNKDAAREAGVTDYACSKGAFVNRSGDENGYAARGWWYLRTPGKYANYVSVVREDGFVDVNGVNVYEENPQVSVRPALYVSLSDDYWHFKDEAPAPTEPSKSSSSSSKKESSSSDSRKDDSSSSGKDDSSSSGKDDSSGSGKDDSSSSGKSSSTSSSKGRSTSSSKGGSTSSSKGSSTSSSKGSSSSSGKDISSSSSEIRPTEGTEESDENEYPSNPYIDYDGNVVWDCVYFGKYYQGDNNGDGVANKYDKKEKIKWRVLSVNNDRALLLSDRCLEKQPFNSVNSSISWQDSTLRSYLNGYDAGQNYFKADYSEPKKNFINQVFDEDEIRSIYTSRVMTSNNTFFSVNGGSDTFDKVFILSYEDVTNPLYGFDCFDEDDINRRCIRAKKTAYVEAKFEKSYNEQNANSIKDMKNGSWWLRTPGKNHYVSMITDGSGDIIKTGTEVYSELICVRPALYIDLSEGKWTKAGIVRSDGSEDENGNQGGGLVIPDKNATPVPSVNPDATVSPTAALEATAAASAVPATDAASGTEASALTTEIPPAEPSDVPDASDDVQAPTAVPFGYLDAWKFVNSYNNFTCPGKDKISKYEIKPKDFITLLGKTGSVVYKTGLKDFKDNSIWSGSGFGMAAVSVLSKAGYLDVKKFSKNKADIGFADILVNSMGDKDVGNIESLINYYYLTRMTSQVMNLRYYDPYRETDNIERIVNKLKGNSYPAVIGVRIGDGKHAVTGYDFKEDGSSFSFKIYDNSLGRDGVYTALFTKNNGIYTSECREWESAWNNRKITFEYAVTAQELRSVNSISVPLESELAGEGEKYIILTTNTPCLLVSDGVDSVKSQDGVFDGENLLDIVSCGNETDVISDVKQYTYRLPVLTGARRYEIIDLFPEENEHYVSLLLDGGYYASVHADRTIDMRIEANGKVTVKFDKNAKYSAVYSAEGNDSDMYMLAVNGQGSGISFNNRENVTDVELSEDASADVALKSDSTVAVFKNFGFTKGVPVSFLQSDNKVCATENGSIRAKADIIPDEAVINGYVPGKSDGEVLEGTSVSALDGTASKNQVPLPKVREMNVIGMKAVWLAGDTVSVNIPDISANSIFVKSTKAGVYDKESCTIKLVAKGTVKVYALLNGKKSLIGRIKVLNPKFRERKKMKVGKQFNVHFKKVDENEVFIRTSDSSVVMVNGNVISGVRKGQCMIFVYVNGHLLNDCYMTVK